ncbi:iron-hydroxamate transporter permease subunit [Klebsiella pneumoniae subsp. pneumoniae KpMDU1]|nr:iron-hydroxamate transporter permease subunit [Klebsiella pneumoniae subsp. pneumoniae KpMDU1]
MNTRLSPLAIILLAGLLGVAFALSIVNLNVALPYAQWRQALWQPDVDDIAQMLFHYSLLPRLAVALLVGAGLGLVGVLFQQVLRNPLAEPTTLGVATGAQLGITVTTLWAIPGVLASQFAALAGAWSGGRAGVWRLVGQAPVAGNADPGGAGGQPLLWRA